MLAGGAYSATYVSNKRPTPLMDGDGVTAITAST